MNKKAINIAEKNFMKVDILDGVRRTQNIFCENDIDCFIVYENKKLVGIVTKKELVRAHPNRILADIMSDRYICINCYVHIWRIKETFDLNKNINVILLENEHDIIGYISRTSLNVEFNKHIDLLTGLYKSDYIFYNAHKFIENKQNTTIIFLDLNNFGFIDKKYGHINGDIILKNVGKILKKSIPSDCYLCRYAGDEFAILTPYCIDKSKLICQNILSTINSYKFPNNIQVSASIGIASCNVHNCNKTIDSLNIINKLINTASLLSTKAKQNTNTPIITGNLDIDAIA
ncbi:diguanylate cyclase [Clostridium sp. BJN0013]|uniref:diguanylate cyclase n=1 Tax=Clostridium sp. BJN0013 TaxID=3236840 RepID=UPI0034C5D085